jgi:hypothetical protein
MFTVSANPCWQPIEGTLFPSQTALPQNEHTPSSIAKLPLIPGIALRVGLEFGLPSLSVARRRARQAASWMPMPEAAMDKDHEPVFG